MRAFSIRTIAVAAVIATTAGPHLLAQQGRDEDVEGILEVQVEDSAAGGALHHFLDTGNGKINLKGNRPDGNEFLGLETGTRVRVHGHHTDANTLQLSPNGSSGSVTTLNLSTSNTFGEQRVAVILVNFQDNPAQPYAWTDAANVTFGQVSDFYRENSYGQTWLTGDVFGWFTIAMSSTTCDVTTMASLAEQAATKAGVNLNNYPRRIFGFPQNACTWWGTSNIGGNPSRSWINGNYALKVVGHELGHAFGDYHSHSMPCDSSGCTTVEYGDDRDIMGQTATGHFQAYQKERYGWLNYGGSPTIQTVTASGTYFLSAYEGGTSPSAIKILKSSSSTEKVYYYIEARTPNGFDAPYAGVDVHTGSSTNANSSYEIDLDPTTPSFDSLLDPGQTFSDATAGLSVTTVSVDGSGAWVSVTYAGTPCTTSTPSVTLSPGSTVTTPGSTASYTMTVRNNDASGCASTNFGIGLSVPSGWNWSAAQPTVSINPGSTAGTTVYVTPPVAASGSATVTALADRPGSTGPDGSSTATLTVTNGLSVTLVTVGGSNYQLSATVSAGSSALAGVNVTFTITDPKGAVSAMSAITNSIGVAVVKGKFKGRDPHGTYYVTASVSSGNLTGSANGTFVY